ncbi:MAG: archaemetzincin [Bacteroidales bacterium]|nr:archaemetzincin [Bacteroidales bacterium]
MEKQPIILVTCGHFEKEVLRLISDDITRAFHHPVVQKECSFDLSSFYNPGRRQYDGNGILKMVAEKAPTNALKTIGLFRVDLFIPILTYIFGQAFLNGNTGIASLFRLKNELYGLEHNNTLQIERFRKVILHELGHTFGLIHCQYPICVMRSSTYVEDIDQKKISFCQNCQNELNRMQLLKLPGGD